MLKKWVFAIVIVLILIGLSVVQFNKIDISGNVRIANLDDLKIDEAARVWEPFYRVRATIIDGQSARFSIPRELQEKEGKTIELTGAGVFYGSGCSRKNDSITVTDFFLLPSLGLAEACELQPDMEMRWTIRVYLKNKWVVHRDDMISMVSKVKGEFRIDTSKPYEAVFHIDNAIAEIVPEDERNL